VIQDTLIEHTQKTALIVGINSRTAGEGLFSTLKIAGGDYRVKMLESSPKNWELIAACAASPATQCAIIKLSPRAFENIADTRYGAVSKVLFGNIAKIPHKVFVHQNLLDCRPMGLDADILGQNDDDKVPDSDTYYFYHEQPSDQVLEVVNRFLEEHNLNIVPYSTNAELSVLASAFVSEADAGLLFRIYVPNDRVWASETDRLLQLFRDYLVAVEQQSIRLDQQRTNRGIIYEFYKPRDKNGDLARSQTGIDEQFQGFSQFLDMAVFKPEEAEALLHSKNVKSNEVIPILTRYAKEARRLQLDMKHDLEDKTLSIRHRMESELSDVMLSGVTDGLIDILIDQALPKIAGLSSVVNFGQRRLESIQSTASVTINIKPQIVHAMSSIVAQEIYGGVNMSVEDQQLLKMVREFRPNQEAEFTSCVRELADDSAPPLGRLAAQKKIISFLNWLGKKGGDVGMALLTSFITKKVGLT
jgi:hypothetical protein